MQVQNAVLDGLMDSNGKHLTTFAAVPVPVVWACAVAKIESKSSGCIDVTLAPEQVWIDKSNGSHDWHVFGEHVAGGVYNFAHAGGVNP